MPPSPDDPTMHKTTASTSPHKFTPAQKLEGVPIDVEQMFHLIDGIIPFEACLYHQVLPLSLKGSTLKLGMVDREDTVALDYVRRILAYLNCSLVPHPITSELHQSMLTTYLNQTGSQEQARQAKQSPKPVDDPATPSWKGAKPAPEERQNQPTLIVDSPEEIETLSQAESLSEEAPPEAETIPEPPTLPMLDLPPVAPIASSLPALNVQAQYLSSPVEVLATLHPQELLRELLARVMVGGIGRLYFERHQERGRILWSLNGVLQSVLDGLSPTTFQGVINELKLLTHLPLIPVQQSRQVEIERRHEQTRLLLRLRVMPGKHGEEATLQVLRGAALKFYQQQQLANLSRDALTIGQQLQQKLNEIRDRARANPTLSGNQLEALPTLNQMLKRLEQQIRDLEGIQAQKDEE